MPTYCGDAVWAALQQQCENEDVSAHAILTSSANPTKRAAGDSLLWETDAYFCELGAA
jgi:hypothetical protein